MWRDFPFVVALVAVGTSIGTFVALTEISAPSQAVIALEHVSLVLLPLSIAFALAVKRRTAVGAWQAQVATAAVSIAFVIVALVKLYSGTSASFRALNWAYEADILGTGALAFGLVGLRTAISAVWFGFVAAICVTAGCVAYAISLGSRSGDKSFVWYLVAGAAAALAGSAAARMHRR